METQRRVAVVKGAVKGAWLQDVMDALDIKPVELAEKIGAPSRRMLDKHVKEGNLGIGYLWSIKRAYPQVNLNYLVFGENPILLGPNASDAANIAAIEQANQILSKRLTQAK